MVINVTQYPIVQQMVINPAPFLFSNSAEVVEEPFSPFIAPVAFLIGLYYGWFIDPLVLWVWSLLTGGTHILRKNGSVIIIGAVNGGKLCKMYNKVP